MSFYNTTMDVIYNGKNSVNTPSKFQILNIITSAFHFYSSRDSALKLLILLINKTQTCDWEYAEPGAWPSNDLLQDETGLSRSQIKSNLSVLENLGFIIRHEGKRRGNRCQNTNRILHFNGFDLSPLIAKYAEFLEKTSAIRELGKQRKQSKKTIQDYWAKISRLEKLSRDKNSRLIDPIFEAAKACHNKVIYGKERAIDVLAAAAEKLAKLLYEIQRLIKPPDQKMYCGAGNLAPVGPVTWPRNTENELSNKNDVFVPHTGDKKEVVNSPKEPPNSSDFFSELVNKFKIEPAWLFKLCPEIDQKLLKPSERCEKTWSDAVGAAETILPKIGVSKDLWLKAKQQLGNYGAACLIITVYAKRGQLKNPPGYIVGMLKKHTSGQLNLGESVMKIFRSITAWRGRSSNTNVQYDNLRPPINKSKSTRYTTLVEDLLDSSWSTEVNDVEFN